MESERAIDHRIQSLKNKLHDVQQQNQDKDSKHNKVSLATLNGRTYTLQELSRAYGFALRTLQNRYNQGKRDAELVRPMNMHQSQPIMFNGEKKTLKQLSRTYGINLSTLYNRYYRYDKRGYDLVQPVSPLAERRVIVYGKAYSLNELSQLYHIGLPTIKERYQQGKRGGELIRRFRPSAPVITYVPMNGHVYDLWELSQMYHIQYTTIKERFYRYDRRGNDLIQAPHSSRGKKKHIIINGKDYTIKQLSQRYHFNYATLTARYRQGKRGEDLIRPVQSSHYLILDGKKYDVKDISKKYHLPISTIRFRYYNGKRGWDLLMPKQKHSAPAKVIIDQKAYTLSELSDLTHFKYSTLSNRYYNYHLRGKDLLHPPFLNLKLHFYGQTFSVSRLARRYGMNVGDVMQHIQERYQRGKRGYYLVSDIEDNYGTVVINGKHYTTKQLAYQYGLKTSTVYQRYYQRHLRGDALIRPEISPNQLSLAEASKKADAMYPLPSAERSSSVRTQGAIISEPVYRVVDSKTPLLTFMLFASDKINDVKGKNIINCVAFDQEATRMRDKVTSTDIVRLTGRVHAYNQRDHDQSEFIIHDLEILNQN